MTSRLVSTFAVVGIAVAISQPVQAQSFRMIAGWDKSNVMAYMPGLQFKTNAEKMSGGKITVDINGPEAVPPFQQMEPASSGAFDLVYTHPTYHSKGLAGVAEILPFGPDRLRQTGVFGAVDGFYQKNHNIKLLALVSIGSKGYHCYMNKPLTEKGDWSGRKLRGVANQHGVIKALGGVPVVLAMGDVYSSIEKGVVDGGCAPGFVFEATKHYEVAKYRVEPLFGLLVSLIGINLDRWNKLPKDQQELLVKIGAQTEIDPARTGDETLEAQNKRLAERGVQVTRLSKEKGDLIQEAFTSSNWELAEKCCGEAGKALQELARKAGLSK